jgi:hypothetical protein
MPRGGARPGAGRKPKQKPAAEALADRTLTLPNGQKAPHAPADWPFGTRPPEAEAPASPPKRLTAREYLSALVNDLEADAKLRLDAAKRLIEFEESKPAPLGKKETKKEAAKQAAGGKFAAAAPPLKAIQGGRA